MTQWHLAQMNVGTALFPMGDPRIAGFVNRLDEINALAEESPGFIWRLKSDSGNATDIKLTDNPLFIVNMSVWESVEALFDFTYKTAHAPVMAKRREWFEKPVEMHMVLWWVEAGRFPDAKEGLERLAHLRAHGPSEQVFTFKQRFAAPA
jgi:hypothetical protein